VSQGEDLAVVIDCLLENDGCGLFTFILKFETEAFDVLLDEGLLWLHLHEGSSVPLEFDVLVHDSSLA